MDALTNNANSMTSASSRDQSVLDVVVSVLAQGGPCRSVPELHAEIEAQALYTFKAKDPVGIVRAAIRRHLRAVAEGKATARLRQVGPDQFAAL